MATALTQDNENFCRLVVLINEKGLDAMRASLEFFSTQKYKVKTFQDVLQDPTVVRKLTNLKGPGKGKPITYLQWGILYPPYGKIVVVGDLDITLCFLLIKNISGLKKSRGYWDKPPAPGDNTLEGGLAQIKFLRNMLCHRDSPCLSNIEFQRHYKDVEKALLDIDTHLPSWHIAKVDIQSFTTLPVSPQQLRDLEDSIKQTNDKERDLFAEIEITRKQNKEIIKKLDKVHKGQGEVQTSMNKIKQATKETNGKNVNIEQNLRKLEERMEEQEEITNKIHQETLFPTYTLSLKEKMFGRRGTKRSCIRYLKRYYRSKMGRIQRIPWDKDDTFDLQDMYVNLCQVVIDKRTRKEEIVLDHYSQMITESKGIKIVIQGHAGMGKTTLIYKIAVDWANGVWESIKWWKKHFPLVLKLQDLTSRDCLAGAIKAQLFNDLDLTPKEMFEFLKIYRKEIVLLLDGFDEFSAKCPSEIASLIKREWFEDMSVILTTRPWRTKEVQDSWDKLVEIKGFKKKDVHRYIDNFFRNIDDGPAKCKHLKQEIEKEQYYPLFETPLIVLINCLVFLDKGEIKSHLTDQYKAVINCMKERANAKGYEFDDYCIENIMDLALQGLLAGEKGLTFSAKEISKRVPNDEVFHLGFFAMVKRPDKGIENLEFVFTHKTLQEYLAACSLVTKWTRGDQVVLQEVEKYCQRPNRFPEMGKLLQFCCSLNEELKKIILPWFLKNLQLCSKKHLSYGQFMVIELTKETAGICQTYNSCVSDHSDATEELRKAKEQFLIIAEKYCYCVMFHKDFGITLGISCGEKNKLLESTKALVKTEPNFDVPETDQILVFDCDFNSHREDEIPSVMQYMTLCRNLKKIRIKSLTKTSSSSNPLENILNEKLEELVITKNKVPYYIFPILTKCTKVLPRLKILNIGWNNIGSEGTKALAESLKLMPNLEELMVDENDISTNSFSHLATNLQFVSKLQKLNISWNRIGEEGARMLGENLLFIPSLTELIMDRNYIAAQGSCYLTQHLHCVPLLKKLNVGLNRIGEDGAKGLGANLQFIPNLEELTIHSNCIPTEGFSCLAKHFNCIPKLKKLDASSNNIEEEGAKVLGENLRFIPNLEELIIDRNNISSKGSAHLALHIKSVPLLKKLDCSFNNIGTEEAKVLKENLPLGCVGVM